MSKKTLSDELQSVLLNHSFDAPEPAGTIDAIFAATIRANGSDGINTNDIVDELSPSRFARVRQLRPAGAAIGIAATVAALVVGVAIVNGARRNTMAGGSSAKAPGTAGSALAGPNPKINGSATPAQPNAPGLSTGPGTRFTVPNDTLDCVGGQRSSTTFGSLPGDLAAMAVLTSDCVTQAGLRSGSEVAVYRMAATVQTKVAELIPAGDKLVVDDVTTTGDVILVRALVGNAATAGAPVGSIVTIRFSTNDHGKTFIRSAHPSGANTGVVAPCVKSTLELGELAGPVPKNKANPSKASAAVITVQNTGTMPCALYGYPTVIPLGPGLKPAAMTRSRNGLLGGLNNNDVAAPVIELVPNGTASAMVEADEVDYLGSAASCIGSTGLLVGLTSAAELGSVSYRIGLCNARVHPFVGGSTGTD